MPRNSNDITVPLRLRRAAAAARSGIRMYWETAVIAAATGIVALAAALPVASIVRLTASGLVPRLELASSRIADVGLVWASTIETPADTQRMALAQLFLGLESAAIAALVVGGLTILAVSGARASQRGSEVAVRRAVGASRRGLLSAAFLEGGLVAGSALVVGGIAGGLATAWAVRSWDGPVAPAGVAPVAAVSMLVALALFLGALFSLVFARSRRVAAPSGPPLQLYICALQLGTSLMVLTGSALTVRHASLLTSSAVGGTGQVYQFALAETDPAERANRYAALLTRLESEPNVAQASLTSPGASVGLGTVSQVITECGVCPQGGLPLKWSFANVTHQFVSADTFLTVGAQVVEGRGITRLDRWDSAKVAVVNRALADHHFEGGKAIGKRLMIHTPGDDWFTVVGIVADPPQPGFGVGFQPANTVYLSVLQRPVKSAELLVRGGATAERVVSAIAAAAGVRREAVTQMGERDLVARESGPLRWFGEMLRIEGWAVFVLALAGTFLLMSLWVRSLWVEIGVHRAVGARRPQVLRRIMGQAAKVGLGSVVVGWWLGPSLWALIGQTVIGLPSWDTGLFVRFSILLTAAALAGALLPALRASRTPVVALLGAGED
ncbi:MAG: FtsX-like permease family protein [Gemmatimonadota bacterium]